MGVEVLEFMEQSPSAETNNTKGSQAILLFITVFTTAHHLFLNQARWMQSTHILFYIQHIPLCYRIDRQ